MIPRLPLPRAHSALPPHRRASVRLLAGTCVSGMATALVMTSPALAEPSAVIAKDASAGQVASQAPKVIPALTNWTPAEGTYRFGKHSRVLIATPKRPLRQTAKVLAEDLESLYDGSVPVVPSTRPSRAGDVVLKIDQDRSKLGNEGYEMVVGGTVRITGATDDGVFYGTRTLLQALTLGRGVPRGRTVDVPRYPERGAEVCPCEVNISMPRIERLIKDMAYLKLNYLLVPLKVKSDSHPETNKWSYYTKAEARRIAAVAERYHVTVIPEINAPGHMEPFLFDRPDLQLTDRDGNKAPGRIDVTKPAAFDFYTDLIDEYAEVFTDSPFWHMGADEYMLFSAYENYPQIGEYAREKFGADAVPADAFIDFINRVDDYVNGKGMTLRVWNDGLTPRTTVPLNDDVVVEHWRDDEIAPAELLDAGRTVMNSAGALYHNRGEKTSLSPMCEDADTLMSCVRRLWGKGWNPGWFEGQKVDPTTPSLSGAHISLWQGPTVSAETEGLVERHIFMPLRFIAQRTWGSAEPYVTYAEFAHRAEALGHAPGWSNVDYRPLPDGTYTIRAATGSGAGILRAKTDEPASELTVGASDTRWQLRHTDDGYYRLESPETGLCVNMHLADNLALLKGEPGVGDAATMQPCNTSSNTQKWEVTHAGRGSGYTITSAMSQMPTTIGTGGTLVQMPKDQAAAGRWRMDIEAHATVDVDAGNGLLERGVADKVTATFTNHDTEPVDGLSITLHAPDGWQVDRKNRATSDSVEPGDSVSFAVTPAQDASYSEDYRITAEATYTASHKPESVSGATSVRIDPISCAEPESQPVDPNDEFDGSALNGCRWTAAQDPNLAALDIADGSLHLKTQPGDLVGGPPDVIENLLLQEAPGGDWTMEIKMTAPLVQQYQQAGLMVHDDDDNFVEFVLVSGNAAGSSPDLYLSLAAEQDAQFGKGGAVNVFDLPQNTDRTWWLRLTKTGDSYSGAYSVDKENWVSMPDTVTNPLRDPATGLFATGPLQQSSATVSFDYYHRNRR